MRKTLLALIAVMLIACMLSGAVAVEAAGTQTGSSSSNAQVSTESDINIPVTGTFIAPSSGDVISVVVKWASMEFVYQEGDREGWKPSDHSYETDPGGKWENRKPAIHITNNSNVAILAQLSFESTEALSITGSFYTPGNDNYPDVPILSNTPEADILIPTSDGNSSANIESECLFGITGGKAISGDTSVPIGTIHIRLSKDNPTSVSNVTELRAALANTSVKRIKLANDINLATEINDSLNAATASESFNPSDLSSLLDSLTIKINRDVTIDLNGKKIAFNYNDLADNYKTGINAYLNIYPLPIISIQNSNCRISNGFFEFSNVPDNLFVEVDTNFSLFMNSVIVTGVNIRNFGYICATDCTFNATAKISNSSNRSIDFAGYTTVSCTLPSSYTCHAGMYNFDPTGYIDDDMYKITSETSTGDSIWIVSEK